MTNLELNKILIEYAKEDLQILKEEGCSAIANTKLGCLHNTYDNGIFTIRFNRNQGILTTNNESEAIEFIANSYQVA
jgi:hypothetical protein